MFLTSCQDILGEWDKPAPVNTIVTPDDNGGGAANSNQYLVYSYSGGTTSSTPENIPDGATTDANLTNTWSGTIVITADKTLTGDVTLTSDVNLIIKDGVELKVNGQILGAATAPYGDYSLKIYGQTESTGKLTLDAATNPFNICLKSLEVHGGVITATNAGQSIENASDGTINIYHGTLTCTGETQGIMAQGDLNIYGGTVTASGTGSGTGGFNNGIQAYVGNINVFGGSLTANGGDATSVDVGSTAIQITMGNLTISGGSVTANGGAGYSTTQSGGLGINVQEGALTPIGGVITISGGTVTATGQKDNIGIYGGDINITGGTVIATAGANSESIGAGAGTNTNGSVSIASTVTKVDMINSETTSTSTTTKFIDAASVIIAGVDKTADWITTPKAMSDITDIDSKLSYDGTSFTLTYQP